MIVRVSCPLPVDWLLMYSIPSTPLIACSSGVATVRAITSAEAPGYRVVTLIVGGTMFGYWEIGSVDMVARPPNTMNMFRTIAKRGCSMKKWVSFMAGLG